MTRSVLQISTEKNRTNNSHPNYALYQFILRMDRSVQQNQLSLLFIPKSIIYNLQGHTPGHKFLVDTQARVIETT